MQFNSETNNLDLYSDARFWCGLANDDTTSYPLVDFTRNANFGLDRAVALIQKSDGVWKWDDTNSSDLPLATTSLVASQPDYSIAVTHLKIERVRAKDSAGNWITLTRVNSRDLTDTDRAATGTPSQYYLRGNSIFLVDAPSYASSGGLEVTFQRGASYFASTDTTKTPGFATQFHRLISLYAALDYCEANDLESRAQKVRAKIQVMEADVIDFYSSRDTDMRVSLSVQGEDYGQSALGSGGRSQNQDGF